MASVSFLRATAWRVPAFSERESKDAQLMPVFSERESKCFQRLLGWGGSSLVRAMTSRVRTFWERESKGDQVVLGQGALSFFLFSGHSELPMPVLCADPNTQRKSYL